MNKLSRNWNWNIKWPEKRKLDFGRGGDGDSVRKETV